MSLTPAELAAFNDHFAKALAAPEHHAPAPMGMAEVDYKQIFCDNWGVASQVLTAIGGMTNNIFVKAAISTIVAAGSALQPTVCAK